MHSAVNLLAFVQNSDSFRGKFTNWYCPTPHQLHTTADETGVTNMTRVKATTIFSKPLPPKNAAG